MDVSTEFAQAVRDKNLLRVRIMLKDSLLIDKTFRLFHEMQEFASAQGASPWMEADIPLEKTEKPWSEDTMNYELTALVNDFTKEHVNYVKEIITEINGASISTPSTPKPPVSRPSVQPSIQTGSINSNRSVLENREPLISGDPTKQILKSVSSINRILQDNKNETTGRRSWPTEDIGCIRRYAQRIVDACDDLQRRK